VIRTTFLALGLGLLLCSAASAQTVRRSGPADPRYYPDLYKGPGWGYTLSEYYTFGNKADGPYGYAIGGYRYGSNYDIQRWKEATGTDVPPGYYLQRLRERRAERFGAPASPAGGLQQSRSQKPENVPTPAAEPALENDEDSEEENLVKPADEPTGIEGQRTSRRNAISRGVNTGSSSQSSRLTGPEQSASELNQTSKLRRIRATPGSTAVDKN
jgi:hypothetical protein